MSPRRVASLLLATVMACGLLLGAVTPASASTTTWTYEKTPFADTVYLVETTHQLPSDTWVVHPTRITVEQWHAAGYPTPVLRTTSYTKHPWNPAIHAQWSFGGAPSGYGFVDHLLEPAEWAQAGWPRPQVATAAFYRWSTSSEVFGMSGQLPVEKLSPAQWAAAGHPEPTRYPGGYVRYVWSPRVFSVAEPATLTAGSELTLSHWLGLAAPSPLVLTDLSGFRQRAGDPAITWASGGISFHVTPAEWAAAGYPPAIAVP